MAPANLLTTLSLGITTVRDAGGADAGLRRAVDDGLMPGPRMQIAVTMLSQTGGHNDPWLPSGGTSADWGVEYPGFPMGRCDGIDGVRVKVREVIRRETTHPFRPRELVPRSPQRHRLSGA